MPPNIQSDFSDVSFLNRINIFDDSPQLKSEQKIVNKINLKEFQDLIQSENNCEYYPIEDFKLDKKSSLNIFHNNFNGLESKHDHLCEFLDHLEQKFDIIMITETSEKNDHGDFLTNVKIPNFQLYSTPTLSRNGGTAIYARDSFDSFERSDLKVMNPNFESTWLEIKNKKSKNILCGVIYRHPNEETSKHKAFLTYLDKILSKVLKENKEIYIAGDFNIDLNKIESNAKYKNFFDLMCSFGLLPKIIHPTRTTINTATIIDNIFTNNLSVNTTCGNLLTDFSDHFGQFVSIERIKIDYKSINLYKRDYSGFEEETFKNDISNQNFTDHSTDINQRFENFYSKLNQCVEKHAPLKKLSPKEIKEKNKPWVTQHIKKLIKYRNKLFRKKKQNPNNNDILRLYNLFRNRVNNELKKSKKSHYKNFFDNNSKDIKKIWEGIKSIINVNKYKIPSISQLKIRNSIIDNQKKIAQELNNFFVNVGPNIDQTIPINPKTKPENFLKNRNDSEFVITNITEEEVLEIIDHLENKSVGPTSIPINLLKITSRQIIKPLCEIISLSFSQGIFPEELKISKVIPIFKSGSSEDVNNYRPISLLSIFDKIIEKLMHKRLYDFLQENNILTTAQFGFQKNMSTSLAIIEITERIRRSMEDKKVGCGLFVDLSKAFDTINHKILISKMEHY